MRPEKTVNGNQNVTQKFGSVFLYPNFQRGRQSHFIAESQVAADIPNFDPKINNKSMIIVSQLIEKRTTSEYQNTADLFGITSLTLQ